MQIFLLTTQFGLRPYGQPGQLPKATEMLPLLIELKAQFYKLVTLQPVRILRTSTCKTVNKSSKSKYLLYRLCIKRKSAQGHDLGAQEGGLSPCMRRKREVARERCAAFKGTFYR